MDRPLKILLKQEAGTRAAPSRHMYTGTFPGSSLRGMKISCASFSLSGRCFVAALRAMLSEAYTSTRRPLSRLKDTESIVQSITSVLRKSLSVGKLMEASSEARHKSK